MTPEEAREIDRLEFEADCRAARERAFAVISERYGAERAYILRWVEQDVPRQTFNSWTPKPASVQPPLRLAATPRPKRDGHRPRRCGPRSANGLSMTLKEWAERLGISLNVLHQRIHKKGSLEGAIALGGPKKAGRHPGVVKNLPVLEGTGGGSLAQDIIEIEFLQ